MKVLIFGGTGMLGSMAAKCMPDEWEVQATARVRSPLPYDLVNLRWRRFDVGHPGWEDDLGGLVTGQDWVVNCLGATKPLMGESAASVVNAVLPGLMAATCQVVGARMIHASTDCVYDGSQGLRREEDPPSAQDDYGARKAQGEPPGAIVVRCSLVGPECRAPARHLLGKTLEGLVRQGYTDHLWNGLTTLHWARLVVAAIRFGVTLPSPLHLVPEGAVTKARLLRTIFQAFTVAGLDLEAVRSGMPTDMRLATSYPGTLARFWRLAGYDPPPTIEQMLQELADFCHAELWPPNQHQYWGRRQP